MSLSVSCAGAGDDSGSCMTLLQVTHERSHGSKDRAKSCDPENVAGLQHVPVESVRLRSNATDRQDGGKEPSGTQHNFVPGGVHTSLVDYL